MLAAQDLLGFGGGVFAFTPETPPVASEFEADGGGYADAGVRLQKEGLFVTPSDARPIQSEGARGWRERACTLRPWEGRNGAPVRPPAQARLGRP
jgi:hypothetical protein